MATRLFGAPAPAPAPAAPDSDNAAHSLLKSSHALSSAIIWGIFVPIYVYRHSFLPSPLPRSEIIVKAALYIAAAAATAIGFWASAVSHHHPRTHLGIAIALLVLAFLHLVGVSRYKLLGIELIGLIVATLAIIDVFNGFGIMTPRPHRVWRVAYLSVMATMIAIAAWSVMCLQCCFQGGVLCFFCIGRRFSDEENGGIY